MAINRYFVASEYDLTLRLQKLFRETVVLQTEFDNAKSKGERIGLKLKLDAAHSEISRVFKEMKYLLSDTGIAKKRTAVRSH